MRVVIDESTVQNDTDAEVLALLRRQLRVEDISSWRYADEGPPQRARWISDRWDQTAVKEWLSVAPVADGTPTSHLVSYIEEERISVGSISGDIGRADRLADHRIYSDFQPEEARARRGRDSVAYGAALAAKADLLVTQRAFLLSGRWFPGFGTTCCTPTDGVALTGQYLRARGHFLINEPKFRNARTSRDTFYMIGARALLPSGWRWQSQSSGDTALLAVATFQRIARCLRLRDSLRWRLYLPQTDEVIEDLLGDLDAILVNLVGAFDAMARATHRQLGLSGTEFDAAWQKERWLKKVAVAIPELAAVTAPGTAAFELFELLRTLRNTLHGEPLKAMGSIPVGTRDAGVTIRLPRAEDQRLAEIIERRGWGERLQYEDWDQAGRLISPGDLVEELIPAAARVLDQLMAIEVAAAPAEPSVTRFAAPYHEPSPLFSPSNLTQALLQLGITTSGTLVEGPGATS